MAGRVDGKIALIAGAGTGIGRACMVLCGREGAKVVGCARTQANLEETLRLTKEAGGDGFVVAHDLAKAEGAEAFIAAAMDAYGRLDILVNCVSVGYSWLEQSPESMGDVINTTPEKWQEVMAINVDSYFYLCRSIVPIMQKQGGGAIVNVASISGFQGLPVATPTPPPRVRPSTSRARSALPTPRTTSARTAWHPASPTRRWSHRCSVSSTTRTWRTASRRWRGPARRRRWPTAVSTWARTKPATATARSSPSTAARRHGIGWRPRPRSRLSDPRAAPTGPDRDISQVVQSNLLQAGHDDSNGRRGSDRRRYRRHLHRYRADAGRSASPQKCSRHPTRPKKACDRVWRRRWSHAAYLRMRWRWSFTAPRSPPTR